MKKKKLFNKSTIVILSDGGVCYESYCRNKKKLIFFNDLLSNVILMIKHNDLNGSIKLKFDLINLRALLNDLIISNFSLNLDYPKYKFYNDKNQIIKKK